MKKKGDGDGRNGLVRGRKVKWGGVEGKDGGWLVRGGDGEN